MKTGSKKYKKNSIRPHLFVENNEKTYFLDFLRVISCLAIIFLHVQHTAVSDDPTVSMAIRQNLIFVVTNLQWAVPMFFMISGYIFLGIKKECSYKSMLKYYIRLILVILFIYTFFNIIELLWTEKVFNLDMFFKSVIKMINGKSFDHLWLINSIFTIYLIMPVFKLFYDKADYNLDVFILISFLFIYLIPTINKYLPFQIGTYYIFDWQMFYVFLGGYFAKKKIVNSMFNNVVMGLLLILIAILNYYSFYYMNNAFMSYSSRFLVVFYTSLIFLLSINILNRKNKFISEVSKYTFNVYIYHVIFIHIMTKVLYIYPLRHNPFFSIIIAYVAITFISFIFCIVLQFLMKKLNFEV